jgi:tetratricopeptide (TPR) repeat protein
MPDQAYTSLGDVQRRAAQYKQASHTLGHALALYREMGDRRGQAGAMNQIGTLLSTTRRIPEAIQKHTDALHMAREIHSDLLEADALTGIGRCLISTGDNSKASEYLHRALATYQRLGAPQANEASTLLASIAL